MTGAGAWRLNKAEQTEVELCGSDAAEAARMNGKSEAECQAEREAAMRECKKALQQSKVAASVFPYRCA